MTSAIRGRVDRYFNTSVGFARGFFGVRCERPLAQTRARARYYAENTEQQMVRGGVEELKRLDVTLAAVTSPSWQLKSIAFCRERMHNEIFNRAMPAVQIRRSSGERAFDAGFLRVGRTNGERLR